MRLDVAVLDGGRTGAEVVDRAVEIVDRFGAVLDVAEKLVVGDAGQSLVAALFQAVEEALIAEAHRDDQFRGTVQGGRLGEGIERRGGGSRHSGDRRRFPPIRGEHGRVVEDFAFVVLDPEGDDRHKVRMVDALDELQSGSSLRPSRLPKRMIFTAASAPPGAVAFHTSPKPPRPRNLARR